MTESPVAVSLLIHEPEALAEAIHNATFQPCQLSASPSPSKLTRVMLPTLCLDFISLGSSLLFTGTMPEESYTLIFVTECERKGRTFNFNIEHNGGYIGIFPPGAALDAYTPKGYANATLTVPAAVFESAVERIFPEIPEHVMRHGAGMRVGATAQRGLRLLLKKLQGKMDNPAGPLASATGRGHLETELLEAFMAALRSGCEALMPPPGLRIARRLKRLKQARDYMAEHLHEPISLTALCDELKMSKRGVEMLFQDSFEIGPNAFLRHQRLHGARRDLRHAPCESGAVKQIALTWGFWHMSHFAREYRKLFGETPRDTLFRSTSQ